MMIMMAMVVVKFILWNFDKGRIPQKKLLTIKTQEPTFFGAAFYTKIFSSPLMSLLNGFETVQFLENLFEFVVMIMCLVMVALLRL